MICKINNIFIFLCWKIRIKFIKLFFKGKNRRSARFQLERLTYKYICRLSHDLTYKPIINSSISKKMDKINIWIYWAQGLEEAPIFVQKNIQHTLSILSEYSIHIVTLNNITKYISLPDFVWDKYHSNIISEAHFSDIVRLSLLYNYGGLWLDSTVYVRANKLPEYITDRDFFAYQNLNFTLNKKDRITDIAFSNWLLYSVPGNPIIEKTYQLLLVYWYKNLFARHYYIFHIIMSYVIENEENASYILTNKINDLPHQLQYALLQEDFNKEMIYKYLEISDFHKLTYKLKLSSDDTKIYFKALFT